MNKRWTGAVNLALNRARHYRVDIFERLLDAVLATEPDHSICTGDLVNLALQSEFDKVRGLLGDRFESDALTLVPGNHDYYVKEAIVEGLFETSFASYLPKDVDLDIPKSQTYPITRTLPGIFLLGLNTAVETPVFMANGRIDPGQLSAMKRGFRSEEARSRFRILLLHHPLLPEPNRRLDAARRLDNADELITALQELGTDGPQLVVHGHNHEFKAQTVPGLDTPLIQVASASKAGHRHPAEFNIYCIEPQTQQLTIERHVHDPETGLFTPCSASGQTLSV